MGRMVSGIKPTGELTLGNYIGAIKPFVGYQDEHELFVFIADLHALTVYNDPQKLRARIEELAAFYLAAGLDADKVCLFRQSDVIEHTALGWALTCNTKLSDLTKMPQYKNYLATHKNEATPTGMLMYPSLMNADILLYDAEFVPVGADQKPHVDLTRDVAEAFNARYGDTFVLPNAITPKIGAKVMSLSDPTKKMSKSESDKGTIYLTDDETTVKTKIRKAVADSEGKVYYDPINKPGISNLISILAAITEKSVSKVEADFKDERDYGVFKAKVAETVWDELSVLRAKAAEIIDSGRLAGVLSKGAVKAKAIAERKLGEVYRKIGLR